MKKIYQNLRISVEFFAQDVILASGYLDPNDFDDMILDDIY